MTDKSKMVCRAQANFPNPILTITDTGNGTAHLSVNGPVSRRVAEQVAAVMKGVRLRSGDLLPADPVSTHLSRLR